MLVSRFGFRGKSTTLCPTPGDGNRWKLEVGKEQIPNHKFRGWRFGTKFFQGSIGRLAHVRFWMLEKSSRYFLQFHIFRNVSLPGLAQKAANISPTVWNIGIAGKKSISWTLSSNNCLHLSVFLHLSPKKTDKIKIIKKKNQLCNPQFLLNPKKKTTL